MDAKSELDDVQKEMKDMSLQFATLQQQAANLQGQYQGLQTKETALKAAFDVAKTEAIKKTGEDPAKVDLDVKTKKLVPKGAIAPQPPAK